MTLILLALRAGMSWRGEQVNGYGAGCAFWPCYLSFIATVCYWAPTVVVRARDLCMVPARGMAGTSKGLSVFPNDKLTGDLLPPIFMTFLLCCCPGATRLYFVIVCIQREMYSWFTRVGRKVVLHDGCVQGISSSFYIFTICSRRKCGHDSYCCCTAPLISSRAMLPFRRSATK